MDHQLQKKLFEEINGYFDANTTQLSERETTHLASTYFDPGYHAREIALMRRTPLIVGHSTQLKAAGDYFAHEDTGVPILVIRQADGGIKAFLNVCRHRGAHVCADGTGNKKNFTCPYHAWTYKADGRLLAAPQPGFPNTDAKENGLQELPVQERHGLVWVVLTPAAQGGTIDVGTFLGALDAELAAYKLDTFAMERQTVKKLDLNWKFPLDGFMEVYHIPALHEKSIGPYVHGKYSPFVGIGPHSRLLGIRKTYEKIRELPFDSEAFMKNVSVNYQIFPNTIAVWQQDHFEIWTSYPGRTPDECVVRCQSVMHPKLIGEEFQKRWDKNWKILFDTVESEDWTISREVQRSLPFVANQKVLFGRNEPGMQHLHAAIDAALSA